MRQRFPQHETPAPETQMDDIFFGGFSSLLRILIVGVLGYVWLVALLRISGKRTLTKLNAFDLVVRSLY